MFVTHKVLVAVVVVAIVIIVAAGICGSYVGALIRAKNVSDDCTHYIIYHTHFVVVKTLAHI